MVPTKRSQVALAFGAQTGVRMTRMHSVLKTVSKALVNLPSLSQTKKLQGPIAVQKREREVPGSLGCTCPVGPLGHPGEVHAAGRELNEEKHVDPPHANGVDREEVARD
jgi:hypothetical protein